MTKRPPMNSDNTVILLSSPRPIGELAAEAFRQGPIVRLVLGHLPSLPDIMNLGRCSRKLYEHVNRCYPELAVLREYPPKVQPGCKWWSQPYAGANHFGKLLRRDVPAHPVVFRYACEAILLVGMDQAQLNTSDQRFSLSRCVWYLVACNHGELLHTFAALVRSWHRTCNYTENPGILDGGGQRSVSLPEVYVVWADVAREALCLFNKALFSEALSELRAYCRDRTLHSLEPSKETVESWDKVLYAGVTVGDLYCAQVGLHKRFCLWCRHEFVPFLMEMAERTPNADRAYVRAQTHILRHDAQFGEYDDPTRGNPWGAFF